MQLSRSSLTRLERLAEQKETVGETVLKYTFGDKAAPDLKITYGVACGMCSKKGTIEDEVRGTICKD